MSISERIVIVGAGIVGLATAYALLKEGRRRVTVLEQETVDHSRSCSHGFSRLLRFEYGPDRFYSEMVRLSLERWRSLEQVAKRRLYTPTGLLAMGTADDGFTASSYQVLRGMGLPVERLSDYECRKRFPQFEIHDYDLFTYNCQAGVLHASSCLRTLKELIVDLGGEVLESCRVRDIFSEREHVRLELSSGEEIVGDQVVLATGAWVHRLLGHLDLPIKVTRQYLLYFAGVPAPLFSAGIFPAFMAEDLYGFPIHQGCNGWVKAASHDFGVPVDPNKVSAPDEGLIGRICRKLRTLLPALERGELVHIDSCMYDVTPDEDFILDRLPYDARVIFATGLSGHGFKFGLLLGELLGSMVCDSEPPVPVERFRLSRFAQRELEQAISMA